MTLSASLLTSTEHLSPCSARVSPEPGCSGTEASACKPPPSDHLPSSPPNSASSRGYQDLGVYGFEVQGSHRNARVLK